MKELVSVLALLVILVTAFTLWSSYNNTFTLNAYSEYSDLHSLIQTCVGTDTSFTPTACPTCVHHSPLSDPRFYNPSMLGKREYTLRLSPYNYCRRYSIPDTKHLHEQRTLYMKDGIVEHVLMNSEDARLFKFDGRTFVIFTRLKTIDPYETDMVIADLSGVTPREIILQYGASKAVEKNWVVNATLGDDLYMSYSLNPHVVLKVDVATGVCTKAFETFNNNISGELRGSSQMISFNETYLIAVVHTTSPVLSWPFRLYRHRFCAFESAPPFRCVSVGPWFRFPKVFKDSRDSIQFCCGLAAHNDGYLISYGVADCIAKYIHLSKEQIARQLPVLVQ